MRYLSYGVDIGILGDSYRSIHVGNVLRHIAAAFAACLLAARLRAQGVGRSRLVEADLWFGLAVGTFWALHPVQADSVSYMSGRRDILVGLWIFVATHNLIVAWRRGGWWWTAGLVAVLLAFASKESAVVAPAAAGLWVAWTTPRAEWRRLLADSPRWLVGGAFVVTATALIVVWQVFVHSQSLRGRFEWWGGSFTTNAATAFVLQARAAGLVVGAFPLIGDYHLHTIELPSGFADARALSGMLIFVLGISFALVIRRGSRLAGFAAIFWFLALLPTSHLVPHHELFAEHYLYAALLGPALILGSALEFGWNRFAESSGLRVALSVAAGALVLVLGARTFARNLDYRDERVFNERVLSLAPSNTRALGNLMYIYMDAGRHSEATVLCLEMSRFWIAGADQERTALVRCVDTAIRAEDFDAALILARELVEHHPEFGRGHRRMAELARARGDASAAVISALRWVETTRNEEALVLIGDALAAGGALPAEGVARLEFMGEAVSASPATRLRLAAGLARSEHWDAAAYWVSLVSLGDVPPDAREFVCEVYRRSESGDVPGWCL